MARGRKRLYGSVIVNGRNEVSNGILSLTNLILLAFFLACFFTLHLPFTRIHLFPALHRGWLELLRDFRSSISEFFLPLSFPSCGDLSVKTTYSYWIIFRKRCSDIYITMEKYFIFAFVVHSSMNVNYFFPILIFYHMDVKYFNHPMCFLNIEIEIEFFNHNISFIDVKLK